MKRKLVYVCLLAMVAGGMMSFSYDIPEKQETGGREDRVISFPELKDTVDTRQAVPWW